MGYAAWHSSFIPPGSLVRSPLTVPGQHKGLRPCRGMYPLTRVGFLETCSSVRRGEGGEERRGKKKTGDPFKACIVPPLLFPLLPRAGQTLTPPPRSAPPWPRRFTHLLGVFPRA